MTPLRSLARLGAGLALIVLLSGFQLSGRPDDDSPDHPDDPRWSQFRGVKVSQDKEKGLLIAQFPTALKAAEGTEMDIGGYLMPLENTPEFSHFILTRRASGCPFCPPNEANEALEVFTKKKIHYEQRQFYVKGRLKLVASSDQGLFFRLEDATAS
ncbi:hypothetical protein BH09PSE2_BH09PSE2_17980 [soil metagenome]